MMHSAIAGRPSRLGRPRRAFTIIEILMVVAIIGILAAVLFPIVGRAQQNARTAKTRGQFSQWSTAIEAFRREYGYYPSFPDPLIDTAGETSQFVEILSGRTLTGAPIATGGNTKKIGFYSFGEGDLTRDASPLLQDGFGNTEIAILLDTNYDGFVVVGSHTGFITDYASAPNVNGLNPSFTTPIRTGVVFYSAGAGNNAADIVKSWK